MKKIVLFVILVTATLGIFAQNRVVSGQKDAVSINKLISPSETIDTLWAPALLDVHCTMTIYICSNAQTGAYEGYICGNNGFGDKEKAQRFDMTGITPAASVGEALVYCYTTSPTHTTNTTLKIYNVNPSSTAPLTVLGTSAPVALSTLPSSPSAGTLTTYTFATPVNVGQKFFVSYVLPTGTGDTAIIVSSNADSWSSADSLSWEMWSDNVWHPIYRSYGTAHLIHIDLVILPVITFSAGVDDNTFFDGIYMEQNQPNPASTATNIHYNLQTGGNVTLMVYDVTGKQVLLMNEGFQAAGKHNLAIDAGKLGKGTYFYSLKSDNHRMTRKMIIE